jgi:hypothetical protein
MREPNQRLGKLVKAAVGGVLISSIVAAPAMAVPNALQRAAEKRAQLKAEQDKKAAEEKAEQERLAAAQRAKDALAFNPFAPGTNTPPSPSEVAGRLAARQNALARVAVFRRNLLIRLAQVSADRRSPNTPPPFTDPRPSDPTRPGPNVAPGPN